jgi:hypothetical protein
LLSVEDKRLRGGGRIGSGTDRFPCVVVGRRSRTPRNLLWV